MYTQIYYTNGGCCVAIVFVIIFYFCLLFEACAGPFVSYWLVVVAYQQFYKFWNGVYCASYVKTFGLARRTRRYFWGHHFCTGLLTVNLCVLETQLLLRYLTCEFCVLIESAQHSKKYILTHLTKNSKSFTHTHTGHHQTIVFFVSFTNFVFLSR